MLQQDICNTWYPRRNNIGNGSPYFAEEMSDLAKEMGFKHHRVTPEDPQSNGFAESFVKVMVKFVHTTIAEGKNPKRELQNYLLHYRAAPHSTTGISPAEALFNRKLKTRLPQLRCHKDTAAQKRMRERHDEIKDKQKKYFDKGRRATPKLVKPGDKILVRQKKSTTSTPFDPKPYTVTEVKGNRVTSQRRDRTRVRSKNHIKVVPERPKHLIPKLKKTYQQQITDEYDFDIDISHIINSTPVQQQIPSLPPPPAVPTDAEGEEEHEETVDTSLPLEEDSSISSNNATLFHLEEEERDRMEQLLQNALATSRSRNEGKDVAQEEDPSGGGREETKKKLRSAKRTLQWNPEMNGETVLTESK